MKRWILVALLLPLGSFSFAQTTTTYTGTVRDLTQAPVTAGQVTFDLKPGTDTTMSGIARFTPATVTCNIQANGSLLARDNTNPCTVTNNTALLPSGTYYRICIQPYFAVPGACFNDYALGSAKDISTIVPTPGTAPAQTFVDTMTTQTISGAKTFSAATLTNPTLSGTVVGTPALSGLWTFNAGITGTGNTGALTAGTGIRNTGNSWGALQTFNNGLLVNASVSPDGSGMKHKRVASCTTAATIGATCNTTVTWTTAFADANYTAVCTLDNLNFLGHVTSTGGPKAAASIVVGMVAETANATSGTLNCIAIHD